MRTAQQELPFVPGVERGLEPAGSRSLRGRTCRTARGRDSRKGSIDQREIRPTPL